MSIWYIYVCIFILYLPALQAIAHHLTYPFLPVMFEIAVEVEHDTVYHLRVTCKYYTKSG